MPIAAIIAAVEAGSIAIRGLMRVLEASKQLDAERLEQLREKVRASADASDKRWDDTVADGQ
jgi:hypothetical protein